MAQLAGSDGHRHVLPRIAPCRESRLRQEPDSAWISSTHGFRKRLTATWSTLYISMLERETRDAGQHLERIMDRLAMRPGMVVPDMGAGSGSVTLPLAKALGSSGRGIVTDIPQEMLDSIAERRKREEHADVITLLKVELVGPGLPAGAVGTVVMGDGIHDFADRPAYARKLREALQPGGRLVIIDFLYAPEGHREVAPPPEQHMPCETLDRDVAEAGFVVVESFDYLPEQYFVIYGVRE